MRDLIPPIFEKIRRKLAVIKQRTQAKKFIEAVFLDSPLYNLPVKLVGDSSGDPREFLNHYSAYGFWLANKLKASSTGKDKTSILDVGSPKMINAILSAEHDITAVVLADCKDSITNIKYVYHDVTEPLPFEDSLFDMFTSTVSLPLIGLARYGDKLDANSLVKFIRELDRVMKPDGELILSMCLGPNILAFNNGWFLDISTIQKLFKNWTLVDKLVDRWSASSGTYDESKPRFTEDTDISGIPLGHYNVIFLHFKKNITND